MKKNNNIEDWYRNELSNYNVEPDKSTWNSLSEGLDNSEALTDKNFSEWYKKEVNKLEERPDYTVWEKLATKLDTANVWDRLVISLNGYDKFIWWRNLAFKGIAIAILFFGSYIGISHFKVNNQLAVAPKSVVKESTNISLNKGITSTLSHKNSSKSLLNSDILKQYQPKNKVNKFFNKVENSKQSKINKDVVKNKSNKVVSSTDNEDDEDNFLPKTNFKLSENLNRGNINTEFDRKTITENDINHIELSGQFLVKKDKNKIIFNDKRFSAHFTFGMYAKRFYSGLNFGFKKQGLISEIRRNTELNKFIENDYLDFGTNLGLVYGYIVSDKFNVESIIDFYSTAGYNRAFTNNEVNFRENLNLYYTSVQILAKKMNNKSTFDNKIYSSNLIGGIYGSYLYGNNSSLDFRKYDAGLVLGYEQDRYINKALILTPGVKLNQGLINIAGNSTYKFAYNYSLEFSLGIKFIFLKKG